MKVSRVEQHIIKKLNSHWKVIDTLSFKSKNLYNYANYLIRQEFINNQKWLHYNEIFKLCKESDSYLDIGSNVGQQTLRLLDKNWTSFFTAIKDWNKMTHKKWNKNNECWELHFEPYYADTIVLKFCRDKQDDTCFWYVSDLLKVEDDCIWADSVNDAKEDFEYKVEQYFQDQLNYYDELLDKFNGVD